MAKLVDAQDLKSCEDQTSCRFKSGLRHHLFLLVIYTEEYPSLVEGTGLENREVVRAAQGFESLFLRHEKFLYRGVEQSGQLVGLITRRS